jgi:uncharacterized protein DUF4258
VGRLFDDIRRLVLAGRYVIGQHAAERLDERGILEWQVVDGIDQAKLIAERASAEPNPTIEVRQQLADGAQVKVIWSHLISVDVAKLVTVYFLEE